MNSNLVKLNTQLSLADSVYQNTSTQIRDSKLSNYISIAVANCFEQATDLSLFSIEIEELLLTEELASALSPAPYNFLLSFDLNNIGHTLDLTQDFGGVCHYLADKVTSIDSVKIDSGHAQFAAKRCSNFKNINYISEDINQLKLPEKTYQLIIVGQLEDLGLDKQEQVKLIKRLQLALMPTGRLVINAPNRDRLNKWTCVGSNITPYHALYEAQIHTTFNERELETAIRQSGFLHRDVYASFSKGRDIQNLLSKEYLSGNPHALNHFHRLGGIGNDQLNEYLVFKTLHQERGEVFDLASRFIVIASASPTRSEQLCNLNFAHFSGTGRKPQWRTTTEHQGGSIEVTKTRLHPDIVISNKSASEFKLGQSIEPQQFQNGSLLIDDWLDALLSDNSASHLGKLVDEYSQWLRELEKSETFNKTAYDVLPFNIIVELNQGKRRFNIIDPEWEIDADFDSSFILFRALFWFAFENKALLKDLAKQTGLSTISLFVLHYMKEINSHVELDKFVSMEEEIQGQISNNFRNKSIEYALLQTFDGDTIPQTVQPACQISWSDEAGKVDEFNSSFILWNASTEEQSLSSNVPAYTKGKDILRVDPIASMGLFRFSSIKLLSKDSKVIWELNSSNEILKASESFNISSSENSSSEAYFTALNQDPHFLFKLADVRELNSVQKVEVSFALMHNQYYDNSMATLSKAVNEQNDALLKQARVLDSKQSEIEYLSVKLDNIDTHRQSLQATIHETKKSHKKHVHNLEEHANKLSESLHLQSQRLQKFENNVVFRTIVRLEGIAKKIVKKLLFRN